MILHCFACGKAFERSQAAVSRYKLKRSFCSQKCFQQKRGELSKERFMQFVRIEANGCWKWKGALNPDGYGSFNFNYETKRAHRVAWELFKGSIPKAALILHNCPDEDHPWCVNPEHLCIGTQQENMADAVKKRQHFRGEQVHCAKLTTEAVREIRERHVQGESNTALARAYKVSQPSIWAIVHRRVWKHVS